MVGLRLEGRDGLGCGSLVTQEQTTQVTSFGPFCLLPLLLILATEILLLHRALPLSILLLSPDLPQLQLQLPPTQIIQ